MTFYSTDIALELMGYKLYDINGDIQNMTVDAESKKTTNEPNLTEVLGLPKTKESKNENDKPIEKKLEVELSPDSTNSSQVSGTCTTEQKFVKTIPKQSSEDTVEAEEDEDPFSISIPDFDLTGIMTEDALKELMKYQ